MPKQTNYKGVILSLAILIINTYLLFFFLNLKDTNYYAIIQGVGFFYLLSIFIFITSVKGESLKQVFFKKDVSGQFGTKKGEKLPFAGPNLYRNLAYTILFAVVMFIIISSINPKGYLHNLLRLN